MSDPVFERRPEERALSDTVPRPEGALPPLPPPLPAAAARPYKSPALALVLSLFPGMGQVYNGQPAKAFAFFSGWAGSIYLTAEVDPMPFAFLIPFVYFYNLVDAYRSALLINERVAGGVPAVEEDTAESPAWGWSMVGLGVLLLLHNFGWLHLQRLQPYWPVLLILAGLLFLRGSVRRRQGTRTTDGGGGL